MIYFSGFDVEVPICRDWTELRESVKMATSVTLLFIDHSTARSTSIISSSFVQTDKTGLV